MKVKRSPVRGLIFCGDETGGVWVVCPYCRENSGRKWTPRKEPEDQGSQAPQEDNHGR